MALILPAKKLQSLLEKKHDTFVVFTHNKSGGLRVVGMTKYLEKDRKEFSET